MWWELSAPRPPRGYALSLNTQQMRWLLDYAAQQSAQASLRGGATPTTSRKASSSAAGSARNGVTAALMVDPAGPAVETFCQARQFRSVSTIRKAIRRKWLTGLGERYEVTSTNTQEMDVGGPIQSPLDALQIILKKHPFEPDQVKTSVVRAATSDAYIVNNREMPDICLQHMVAVMLLDKTASFKAAHDKPRMQDPAVLRERAKVQLIGDEELENSCRIA